jgi:ADP-ribosyl-[dinitrogen reductase] hydrolase
MSTGDPRLIRAAGVITTRDRYRGCLLGGAVGDALGAGVEFASLAEIRRQYGPAGVTGYVPCYGRSGAITDDTQMTLFTAEGLLRARRHGGDVPDAFWQAYQRWLLTQGLAPAGHRADGWLIGQEFLHHQRSPGLTCLNALEDGRPGTVSQAVNDSKGCGGVMRVAPAGLADGDPFTLGCQAAALTHGHPSGYLAAGAFAQMISDLVRGRALPDVAGAALAAIRVAPGGDEVSAALARAMSAAAEGPPSTEAMCRLGEGWVAEEALAVAVYCALTAASLRSGVLLAVNHGGDSDSTGAICGNLLGASLGMRGVAADLLDGLEGRDVITQVADDLYEVFADGREPPSQRYPG